MKRRIVEWRSYVRIKCKLLLRIWLKLKTMGHYIYDKANIITNLVTTYVTVIQPLVKKLTTILQWAFPVIVLYGQDLLDKVKDLF